MPNKYIIDIAEKQKPNILVCGNNFFSEFICLNLAKSSEMILINNKTHYINSNNLMILKDQKDLRNINGKIDYSIIFLEDNKILSELLEKVKKDNSKTIIIIDIRKVNNYYNVIQNLTDKDNFYIVLLGDLFGKNVDSKTSSAAKIIQIVKQRKPISLLGNELLPIFPVSLEDAFKGISHILFGNIKKVKVFYLFYKYPSTLISSLLLLKRIEPDLEISYEGKNNQNTCADFNKIDEDIKKNTKIIPDFLKINFQGFEKSAKQLIEDSEKKEKYNFKKKIIKLVRERRRKKFMLLISSFAAAFLVYLIAVFSLFVFSLLLLKASLSSAKEGNFSNASRQAFVSTKILSFIDYPVTATFEIMPYKKSKFSHDYNFLRKTANIIYFSANTLNEFKEKGIRGDFSNIDINIENIRYVYFEIQKIRTENNEIDKIFKKIEEKYDTDIFLAVELLPEIFALNNEKNYLVLFQNNSELRPGGGFIGSVAEITFSKGKIKFFTIRDVYELDGQLKAHIEPHYIIRKNLQQHLYLRDSNFSLDFEDSARSAALIYYLETGKKVDGIITVNYEMLSRIIKELEELPLYEYKTVLNENNTLNFIQNTIETNFFPGSTQKKEILNSIFDQLFSQLLGDQKKLLKVIGILPDLLNEKHIQFVFKNDSIQKVFRMYGYAGSIKDQRQKKEYTLYDTVGVNEANIGINKANMNITRDIEYKIFLEKNQIRSRLLLNLYSNKNDKEYKSYIRVITPLNSKLTRITIDDRNQNIVPAATDFKIYENINYKQPKGLEVSSEEIEKYQVFGFVTSIKSNKNQKIEIEYTNGIKPEYLNYFSYNLLFLKQSGTENYPLKVDVYFPQGYNLKDNAQYSIRNNLLTVKSIVKKDKEINAEFVKMEPHK